MKRNLHNLKALVLPALLVLLAGCQEEKPREEPRKAPVVHSLPGAVAQDTEKQLDNLQMVAWLAPVMEQEQHVRAEYVLQFMSGKLMDTHEKIGNFTPVVVSVSGDDYGAEFYILLDSAGLYVSHFRLSGGLCAGPDTVDDSVVFCPQRHSEINRTHIRTIVLKETFYPDSAAGNRSVFDSLSYLTLVQESGKFNTRRTDSLRYTRLNTHR